MKLWRVDLTTEDGIRGAMETAGFACFVAAGLTALSLVFVLGLGRASEESGELAAAMLILLVPALAVYLIAGWRFRAGKGVIWGSAAILVTGLFLLTGLLSISLPSILTNGIVMLLLIGGVRGAIAARRGLPSDTAEIFE
jgi:hypothetical protein